MKKQTNVAQETEARYNAKQERKAHKDFRMQRKQRNIIWQALEA